ncbi:MAG: right-handed parallel beta-helix repeat-containing protein, partial [Ignavibacteriae bacterium]|nr:right-handed parallel beta-helix repeat-containing protein [Ignavibacteriota bacterium]
TSGIGLPRLFWRSNMGLWDSTTATFIGSNQYSFTFGAGAVAGDTIKYYVVAQDTLSPPNVGTFPAGGAGNFTANPPRAGKPPNTPSKYLIVQSPMSGVFTIPGSYPSFWAAENDMYERGIGGPCTFNVAAGYTETISNLLMRTTGTLSNPIIFQKSGSGANPKITAGVGTGAMDGIIIFPGTDYITFDGIDLLDLTTQMEWGYALLKVDGTNGSQNITIKNCSITLQKANTSSNGIYSANHTTISTTALTVTAFSGTNSNNKFYNNTIQNCYSGIFIGGFADVAPYVYYDNGNDIGSLGGNTIRNFGGGSATTYGIYTMYQDSLAVSNNNVGGGTGSTAITYGIYIYYGYNANATIYNNTVSDTTATLTSTTYGIAVYYVGNTGVDNTVTVKRNTVQGMTNTGAGTSAALYGYYIYYTTSNNLYIDSNRFVNNKWGNITGTFTGTVYSFYNYTYTTAPTAGSTEYITNNYIGGNKIIQSAQSTAIYYGMYNYYGLATVNSYNNMVEYDTLTTTSTHYGIYMYHYYSTIANIYNNTVRNIYKIDGSIGAYYGIYLSNAAYTGTCNYYNNSVYNISCGVSIALLYGQYLAATSATKNIYGNTVHDLWATTSGSVYGIYQSGGTTVSLYKNSVYNLRTATGFGYGMYIASGTTNYIYNNYISDIRADSSLNYPALYGLYISGGTNDYVFYNTIYLNAVSTGTYFGTAALYASTTPMVDLRNNNIVNVSTPGVSGGYTVAHYRSSSTISSYSSSSNCNNFYAGTPDTNHIIYYDGTNYMRTLADYKSFVTPRDGYSVTENPPFVNVITRPYDLHINASIATQLESMGTPISSPIAITTDFDGNARYPNTGYPVNPSYPPIYPDIGADEFGGIPNYPVPLVPTLVSPTNGSTGNPLSLNLVWNKKQYGLKYHLLLATDSNFTNIIVNDSTLTDSVKAVSNLNTLTTYYWKVRSGNYSGWGSFSGWYSFKTLGVPTQVSCYAPANGAINQPVNITFVWYKAIDQTDKTIKVDNQSDKISDNKSDKISDNKSDKISDNKSNKISDNKSDNAETVTNYWLEYTTDSTFATGVVKDSSLTDTTKSVTGLSYNTKYWWRVKAKNSIGWGVFSNIWNFKTVAYLQLNLKCYLEGSWNGTTQISDTIRIYLALGTVPYTLVDSQIVMLGTNGTSNPMFTGATSGSYYIVVKHRNHLETWSALPQTFVAGTPLNYDFTTDSTKAFGMNMKKIGTGWAFIVGDANQDGSIDASDVVDLLIPQYGNTGYLSCDFNGDGSVDAADIPYMIANYGMAKYVPSEPFISPEIKTQKRMIKQQELNQIFMKKTKKTNNNNN